MRRALALVPLAAAACAGSEESDRWRYERLIHEQTPEVRSHDDASERYRAIRGREALDLGELYGLALVLSESLAIDG